MSKREVIKFAVNYHKKIMEKIAKPENIPKGLLHFKMLLIEQLDNPIVMERWSNEMKNAHTKRRREQRKRAKALTTKNKN